MIGQTFGRYRIDEQLGAGGMGVVYRAEDTELLRPVAIKVLDSGCLDEAAREAILREARAASALNHPHTCAVYEVSQLGGRPCIVMEFVDGASLADMIPPRGLPCELVIQYGTQIADALAHAHERGVIHRDLKSANAMVTKDGRVKVLDFGLARQYRSIQRKLVTSTAGSQEGHDRPAGTLAYMSPDLLEGRSPSASGDVWALGVLLSEMACGDVPFHGSTSFQLATAIQRDAPTPVPRELPAGLRAVIARCLTRDPSKRYQQAREVRAALEAVARDGEGEVSAAGKRSGLLWVAALLLIALTGARVSRPRCENKVAAARQSSKSAPDMPSEGVRSPGGCSVIPTSCSGCG